ncbi:hypothetical protein B484DRAFT_11643 [Ochromonadaceae sp. CCMP2298]|nr:hypothetical protein B484DRAFT_11643 [Ochromonadaceae sp. CCMP2298]
MIQVGRAERVIVIAGDSASSDNLMPWLGNGFRILGAATICPDAQQAAKPFNQCRDGMILGSGGIGMILESEDGARRRHLLSMALPPVPDKPVPADSPFRCRLLGTLVSNSAFHGAAMDRKHIAEEMERFVVSVEKEQGISREEIAKHGVYFSHETGTHASPSSSCAANEVTSVRDSIFERMPDSDFFPSSLPPSLFIRSLSLQIYGLRQVFGEHLKDLLILNTKGFTGHPMGVSFEDVVACEVLTSGRVPPVANFSSVDPNLGSDLKISKGGVYPCKYAMRFAAGFGSQIALALYGI